MPTKRRFLLFLIVLAIMLLIKRASGVNIFFQPQSHETTKKP
jgi:hypothetical protein